MNRTQNGTDYTSLEDIYYQHKDMVYSIALAAVQNQRDAEDVTLYTFREVRNILYADPSGYRYATISNLVTKSKGVYGFTASNGDAPLSGTKFTYYSAGTAISDLPFSSSYFETDGSVLKKAVIVDNSNTVYK